MDNALYAMSWATGEIWVTFKLKMQRLISVKSGCPLSSGPEMALRQSNNRNKQADAGIAISRFLLCNAKSWKNVQRIISNKYFRNE